MTSMGIYGSYRAQEYVVTFFSFFFLTPQNHAAENTLKVS